MSHSGVLGILVSYEVKVVLSIPLARFVRPVAMLQSTLLIFGWTFALSVSAMRGYFCSLNDFAVFLILIR